MKEIMLDILGWVKSPRAEAKDDFWGDVEAEIHLNPDIFEESSTQGLQDFSHLEVVFHMHQVKPEKIVTGARHPRNDPNLPKVGILAQRGKSRPNRLGISRAAIVAVDGLTIRVKGLDAIDGTPIIDLKPYTKYFVPSPGEVKEPEWLAEIMSDYYK